jgi:hypothetical protein
MREDPHFGNGNYYICHYCKNYMIFPVQGFRFGISDEFGCKLEKESDGRFPSIVRPAHTADNLFVIQRGCDNFESSGLPAHPIVLEELVKINIKTISIPSDPFAIEDGYAFTDKIRKYLPKEQIIPNLQLVRQVD